MTINEYEAFLKWHFENWKLNCAHSDSVEEARKIYDRIYQNNKPNHIAERERGFMAWKAGKAQAVPDTHLLVEKKNTEDWYLDDDEYIWLDHDGIDGTLCELGIGEVKPVEHKEYLITQSRTLYAARVWDDNDDHLAWKLFESEEAAIEAANHCKAMYDESESGAKQ